MWKARGRESCQELKDLPLAIDETPKDLGDDDCDDIYFYGEEANFTFLNYWSHRVKFNFIKNCLFQ